MTLSQLATAILANGPTAALGISLRQHEARDWTNAAQNFVDTDGDDEADLVDMFADYNAVRNAPGYGGDEGDWRDSAYAERMMG